MEVSFLKLLSLLHGSTGVRIMNANFVIIGGDGKTFDLNNILDDVKFDKVHKFGVGEDIIQIWGARAGISTKLTRVADLLPQYLEQAKHQNDQLGYLRRRLEATPGAKDDWIFVFGGFHEQDGAKVPFLFCAEPNESYQGKNYYSCGSGSRYASRVLDKITSVNELTKDEAIMWVERALLYASIMDHCTGGRACIKAIVDGIEVSSDKHWILTGLLEKHIGYFRELNQRDEKDQVAREVCDFYNLRRKYKYIKWMGGESKLWDGQWMDFQDEDSSGEDTNEEDIGWLNIDTEESDTNESDATEPDLSGDAERPTKKPKTDNDDSDDD